MKPQTMLVLTLIATISVIVDAQPPKEPPLPEITNLIQQTILQQRFAESREQDYVFREETNDIRLKKECTWAPECPAPFGIAGVQGVAFRVTRYTERDFEIFWLDGTRVARILPSCDRCGRGTGHADSFIKNIPVSESELATENQRVDSEVAEARNLHAQRKDVTPHDEPPQIIFSRMLELCTFSNARREVIEGRSTILLDFAWNPSLKPTSSNEALLKSFTGTVGIDEQDHSVQHVEGRFLANVNLDGGNIKIRKGTRVTIENRRVERGIWMLSNLDARGEAHYFAFAIDGDGHIFNGNYWKFQSTSRILPGYAEVPNESPAPPSPTAPRNPPMIQ